MNLFRTAKKQQPPPPDASQVVLKLKSTVETLERREAHIQKKVRAQLAEAKQRSAAKDKNGALFALKRKRILESEIDKLGGAQLQLYLQIQSIESARINAEVVDGLQAGVNMMQQLHEHVDVERAEDVKDSLNEQMETANDISNIISESAISLEDDDELVAELNQLEEEAVEAELLKPPADTAASIQAAAAVQHRALDFPVVPKHGVQSHVEVTGGEVTNAELRELQKLEASMAVMAA